MKEPRRGTRDYLSLVLRPVSAYLPRRVDLGLFVVLAACLLAIWPFISRPGLPQQTDAELHIYRTAELAHLLRAGAVYPRWAPDFYFGYGYPIFNYYAPLVYYLAAGLTFLPVVNVVLAVKLVFVLGLVVSGWGMYAFVRDRWGVRPGVLAAVSYLFAPYVLYIDPHARGVLAEFFSFALFPWVLWAFDRLAAGGGRWRVSLAAGLLAALICTHNLMALVFVALLAGWIGWQWLVVRRRPGVLLLAFALGVGLAAFFWLPVTWERGAVQLGNVVGEGGHYDFRNHFLNLSELLGSTLRLDLGATEPAYRFNLGVAQWVLGLAGAAVLLWRTARRRPEGLFFVLASAGLTLLVLPLSQPIWEHVPMMAYLQFPWRLLGPLAACLAVLAGVAFAELDALWAPGGRRVDAALGLMLLVVLLLALPLTYPPTWPADFGPTDPAGIVQAELSGRWLGTTSTADYVPADVAVVPRASEQLLAAYRAGGPVDRVNRATVPAGAQVELVSERPLAWTYQIDSPDYFVFRLFHFYFPGWTARLDGEPVLIRPADPDGFMTVEVPAGRHGLEIAFRDTPARTAGWAVSAAALLGCLVVGVVHGRRPELANPVRRQQRLSWLLLLAPLTVLVFKLALADPLGWFRLQSQGLQVLPAQNAAHFAVGDEIALLGYDWNPADPGRMAELTLYWKALAPVPTNYQVFVHLRDAAGAVVAQSDKLNPGDYPTERWPLDKYVRDQHRFALPADLAPGEYRLTVGLWLMAEGQRLAVRDAAGELLGDSVVLQAVRY